ncbi:MAG TPA: flavin reductase family protein [Candidatus Aquicultor sp.]
MGKFTDRKAMGAIGSPVVLITAAHEGHAGIMTINMVAGISFNPPLTAVSLSHHSHTRSLIEQSGEFAINIIGPDLIDLAKNVGMSTGNRIDKFAEFNIDTEQAEVIQAPLVHDAHTVLECRVEKTVDLGNHSLYVGRVVAYHECETEDKEPLYLYHGHYCTIGNEIGKV